MALLPSDVSAIPLEEDVTVPELVAGTVSVTGANGTTPASESNPLPVEDMAPATYKTGTASSTGVFIAAFEAAHLGHFTLSGTTSGSWVDAAGQAGLISVEGTNDPAALTGWSAIRMENPNGQSTTAPRGGGTYSSIVTTRWLRVNCLVYKGGSYSANLAVFQKPRSMYRQNIKDIDGIASLEMTPGTGQAHVAQRTFLVGGNFDGSSIDSTVWTVTATGSGTATESGGALTLATGTTANSTIRIETVRKANLIAGISNIAEILAATDSAGASGCVKRWGIYNDDSGVFFEQYWDGSAGQLTIKTRKGGVDTGPGSATNGINNITNFGVGVPVYALYELQIDPLFVKAKQNSILVHLFSGLFPSLFSSFSSLPLRFEVINSGGATTNNKLYLQNAGCYRLGQPATRRADESFQPEDVLAATGAVIQGKRLDGTFTQLPAPSRDALNSSTTTLGAGGVFRGIWREWQGPFVGIVASVTASHGGTLHIDMSSAAVPVDGDDSSIDDDLSSEYDPSIVPLLRRVEPVQSRWVRVRYVNGAIMQTSFSIDAGFFTSAPPIPQLRIDTPVTSASLAATTRSVTMGQQPDNDYENVRVSGSDPGNTTTATLLANATFTGTPFDATGFLGICVIVKASHVSATNGLKIQFSNDGFVTVSREQDFTYGASDIGTGRLYAVAANQGEQYRIVYTNGTTNQTSFDLRTELTTGTVQTQVGPLESPLVAGDSAQIVRSVLSGKIQSSSTYENVGTDGQGRILTNLGSKFNRLLNRSVEDTEELRTDVEPTNTDLYVGKAADGTATSAASWEVIRIYLSSTQSPTRIRYRTGVKWDERNLNWT